MNENAILLDWLDALATRIQTVLKHIPAQALHWQPDPQSNSICLTVWHVSRAWDVLTARILGEQPANQELWYCNGWLRRTGYDPSGKGWGGFGNLAGYTPSEVAQVPRLSREEYLTYFDQVYQALRIKLMGLNTEDWHVEKGKWSGQEQPVYDWISNFLRDGYGHLGEIRALASWWKRAGG